MEWWIAISFFTIALFYSAAGFGGGSSYLAILALTSLAVPSMRFTALMCNLVVVSGSVFNFHRKKIRPWKDASLILLISVPMAFIGGRILLEMKIFLLLLGFLLILASILMLIDYQKLKIKNIKWVNLPIIGGVIGFVSGLVGIGGGIFLSPILHLTRWKDGKEIAAMASFFILVNSMAGLLGQFSVKHDVDFSEIGVLLIAVLLGGQIGNRVVIKKLKPRHIRLVTSVLIGIVGVRLIIQNI